MKFSAKFLPLFWNVTISNLRCKRFKRKDTWFVFVLRWKKGEDTWTLARVRTDTCWVRTCTCMWRRKEYVLRVRVRVRGKEVMEGGNRREEYAKRGGGGGRVYGT